MFSVKMSQKVTKRNINPRNLHAIVGDKKRFKLIREEEVYQVRDSTIPISLAYKVVKDQTLSKLIGKIRIAEIPFCARTVMDQVYSRYEVRTVDFQVSVLVLIFHKRTHVELCNKRVLIPVESESKLTETNARMAVALVILGFMDEFKTVGSHKLFIKRTDDSYSCVQFNRFGKRGDKDMYLASYGPLSTDGHVISPSVVGSILNPPLVPMPSPVDQSSWGLFDSPSEAIDIGSRVEKLNLGQVNFKQYGSFLPQFEPGALASHVESATFEQTFKLSDIQHSVPGDLVTPGFYKNGVCHFGFPVVRKDHPGKLGVDYIMVQDALPVVQIDESKSISFFNKNLCDGCVVTAKGKYFWGDDGRCGKWVFDRDDFIM